MNLDDYISKMENDKEKNDQAARERKLWAKYYYNLDTYSHLTSEDKNLLKEFKKYITRYDFNRDLSAEFDRGTYGMAQIETADHNRMAVMIEKRKAVYRDIQLSVTPQKKIGPIADFFSDFLPASYFHTEPNTYSEEEYLRLTQNHKGIYMPRELKELLSEEEYNKRLSNFKLIGSQDFYALSLVELANDYFGSGFESDRNYYVFYSKDGNIFVSDGMHDIYRGETLGNYLADQAIKIKRYPH